LREDPRLGEKDRAHVVEIIGPGKTIVMDIYSFLSYLAALSSIGMALLVLYRDPHSFVHRTFAGGMTILAVQAVWLALSLALLRLVGRRRGSPRGGTMQPGP
jgi:hypothetical protein